MRLRLIVGRNKALDSRSADHGAQVTGGCCPAFSVEGLRVGFGHAASMLQRAVRLIRGRANVRQDQVLQGLDPVAQRNAHSIAPSDSADAFAPGSEEMRIARAVRAHRLSENRK